MTNQFITGNCSLYHLTKMSEQLCLQWNDFKDDALSAFRRCREDKEFADVTLACEDGNQVEVHKVILATSSPFFDNLLRRNKHTHPLIYMRGVKSQNLEAIIDFLYFGETNVDQENLDSFLAFAEELQLKGLMETDAAVEEEKESETFAFPVTEEANQVCKKETNLFKSIDPSNFSGQIISSKSELCGVTVALTNPLPYLQELNKKCNSMMVKTLTKLPNGNLLYKCKVCGKVAIRSHMKSHIEINHFEGVSTL